VGSGEDAMVCATCDRRATPQEQPQARLTWAGGVEGGAVVWTCDRCSREHLRSIEGKLDSPWW
jgi:RNase P subunit RPR2